MKEFLQVTVGLLCLLIILYLTTMYSFLPRYEAWKNKNYDCIWAQDAYSCMLIRRENR